MENYFQTNAMTMNSIYSPVSLNADLDKLTFRRMVFSKYNNAGYDGNFRLYTIWLKVLLSTNWIND